MSYLSYLAKNWTLLFTVNFSVPFIFSHMGFLGSQNNQSMRMIENQFLLKKFCLNLEMMCMKVHQIWPIFWASVAIFQVGPAIEAKI